MRNGGVVEPIAILLGEVVLSSEIGADSMDRSGRVIAEGELVERRTDSTMSNQWSRD